MSLASLRIQYVRNLSTISLTLHSRYNFFSGPNGCGKTSLLEAVYLLARGCSFRTREVSPLIQLGETALTVYAETLAANSICIQKSPDTPTNIRINSAACHKASELARLLPCQVFYQDIFQIIDAGPAVRRKLLDWGVFHVKPTYHELWAQYRRVVKQRNALLKQRADRRAFKEWNRLASDLSQALDELRREYFDAWTDVFKQHLSSLIDIQCDLQYFKGWDKKGTGKPLDSILDDQFEADLQRQYTSSGAHQADILFNTSTSRQAKQWFSRGQQKMLLIALKLAQADLLDTPCVYLFDDVFAELDEYRIQHLFKAISAVPGQFFFTSNQDNHIAISQSVLEDAAYFSLRDGDVRRM